jgi:hypothetical protein
MSRRHGAHDAERIAYPPAYCLGKVEAFPQRRSGHCVIRSAWARRSIFTADRELRSPPNRGVPKRLAVHCPHVAAIFDIPRHPRDCQPRFLRHLCGYVE